MRSIKNLSVKVLNINLKKGNYYILEFPNRTTYKTYIFEFAGISPSYEGITIMHRNKYIVDSNFDNIIVVNGNKAMVTIPCGENIRLKKYWGKNL